MRRFHIKIQTVGFSWNIERPTSWPTFLNDSTVTVAWPRRAFVSVAPNFKVTLACRELAGLFKKIFLNSIRLTEDQFSVH